MPVAPGPPASGAGLPGGGEPGNAAPLHPYAYAAIRVVPRIERGECLNVGVVLFCRSRRFLAVRTGIDAARLRALAPDLDLEAVRRRLDLLVGVAAGDAAAGAIAGLLQSERFGWLVAPVSTVVQPGPVHPGLAADPAAALDRLFATMVGVPTTGSHDR